MKLTLLLSTLACLHVSAAVFSQRVTLNEKKAPLEKVFMEIRRQTGFNFLFSSEELQMAEPVTIVVKDAYITDVLQLCFRNQPFFFSIDRNTILVSRKSQAAPIETPEPAAPPIGIHGRVTNQKGEPVAGATISVKGKWIAVATDEKGEFQMSGVESDATIVISSVGYESKQVRLNGVTELTIILSIAATQLDTAAVNNISTGYQVFAKERATGSFVQVDNTLFNRRVSTDILNRLEGVVPGLLFNRNTVTQNDISIRGNSTFFANSQPLVIVDNFPYEGDLNNLNPNDVESITVLKDAAAASIWGVRSGNGVIVITTKKGRRNNKLVVEVNTNLTIGDKPNVFYSHSFLPSNDFINIEQTLFDKGVYDGDLTSPYYTPVTPVVQLLADKRAGLITAADATSQIDALRKFDVRNDISKYFYRKSVNQQYAINLRGGANTNAYFFSAGFDDNLSSSVGSGYKRINLSSGIDFNPVKNLLLSTAVYFTQSTTKTGYSPTNNVMMGYKGLYPYARLADDAGNALAFPKAYTDRFTDTAGGGKFLDWTYRPLDEIKYADNTATLTDNRINLGIRYDFIKGLNAEVKYQYERTNGDGEKYYSDSTYYMRDMINTYTQRNANGSLSYPVPIGGMLNKSGSLLTSHKLRAQGNFNHTWNNLHEVAAIAGAEVSETINSNNADFYYGYDKQTGNAYSYPNFQTTYQFTTGGSGQLYRNGFGFSRYTDHYISYFGNAAYTYDRRYVVSASARVDKSNMFGVQTNQKAVPLYSTGLAWNIDQEKFYDLSWLPHARFRATYGYTANINKSATAVTTIRLFNASASAYTGIPYASPNSPGNPDLRWEKLRMINLGIDFGTKNDRVTGTIEFYFKKGIDLFGYSSLAASTGLTSFFGNTASITGHGFDITLNTVNVNVGGFQWTSNLLLSNAVDKVSSYGQKQSPGSYLSASSISLYPAINKPLYGVYSYRWAGLDPQTGDPQGYLNGKVSKDYNSIASHNTSIDSLVYNGPARPTIYGSFRNTFFYAHFSLSVNFIYKLNYYYRRNGLYLAGLPWSGHTDYYKRWQQPGDENHTDIPSIEPYPPYNSNRAAFYQKASILVEKADHIRLQDINLSYSLTRAQIKKLPFTQLDVYFYANNIGILWRANHQGEDPDLSSNSIANLPIPRTMAFGLKAAF